MKTPRRLCADLAQCVQKNDTPRSWRCHTRKNSIINGERWFVTSFLLNTFGWTALQHCHCHFTLDRRYCAIDSHGISLPTLSICVDKFPNSQPLFSRRTLMNFQMTWTQLATRRLIADYMALFLLGPDAFALLFELSSSKADQRISVAAIEPKSASCSFQVITYCLKCTHRISSHGCFNLSDLQSINLLFV